MTDETAEIHSVIVHAVPGFTMLPAHTVPLLSDRMAQFGSLSSLMSCASTRTARARSKSCSLPMVSKMHLTSVSLQLSRMSVLEENDMLGRMPGLSQTPFFPMLVAHRRRSSGSYRTLGFPSIRWWMRSVTTLIGLQIRHRGAWSRPCRSSSASPNSRTSKKWGPQYICSQEIRGRHMTSV